MKRLFTIGFFVFVCGFFAFGLKTDTAAQTENKIKTAKKIPVLLELFTSEGCPTCPPADANLARLDGEQPVLEVEIITLALHVDYWNSVTWKDKYSSPIFSRRQQIYTQALKTYANYTPQMVVDGQTLFAGGDMTKARKAISEAAKVPKATIEITAAADKFKIEISGVPAHQNATIFLAVAEDNLASGVRSSNDSNVKPAHTSVVRELKSLGMLTAQQTNLEIETVLQIQADWKRENIKLIVFVQENASRRVLGVGRIEL